MKQPRVTRVSFNNRKKQLVVEYGSGTQVLVHYGQVGIRKNLRSASPDRESGGRAIRLEYRDQTTDYMPYDQPLAAAKDPEFMLRHDLEVLIARIRQRLAQQRISLRHLAERLKTSDAQVQRLLDPSILRKNLGQLYAIGAVLNLKMEVRVKDAA